MASIAQILQQLPVVVAADADALLRQLGAALQVGDYLTIAACDYGHGADKHIDGLCRILLGDMPRPLRWHPAEVLELTRWDEPDAGLDPYAFEAAHRRRAFACAALLRSLGNETDDNPDGNQQVGPNQTLIQLIASLRVVETAYDRPAAAFLQWLIPQVPHGEAEESAFLGLGLFWFALAPDVGVPDAHLLALADWVMAAEDAVAGQWREILGAGAQRPWLLSTTSFTMRHEVWRAFAGWLVERAAARPALQDVAQLIAAAMLEPKSEW